MGERGAACAKLKTLQHKMSTGSSARAGPSTKIVTASRSTGTVLQGSSLMFGSGRMTTVGAASPNSAAAQPKEPDRQERDSRSASPMFPPAPQRGSSTSTGVGSRKRAPSPHSVGGQVAPGHAGNAGSGREGGSENDETLVSGVSAGAKQPSHRYGSRNGGLQISERRRVRGTPPPVDSDED